MRRAGLVAIATIFWGCGKTQPPAPVDAAPPEPAFEAPPSWLPLDGPPAGREACRGAVDAGRDGGTSAQATDAVRACFATRIRPALLAVAKTRRLKELDVGSREHMEHQLASAPRLGCSEQTHPGEAKPQWRDEPKKTILGSAENVVLGRPYFLCSIEHSAPGTPADAGYYIGMYVDAATLDVVYAYRPDCC